MKLRTAAVGLITLGVAIPLMAAEQSANTVEQAGRPNPGPANTSYRLAINFKTGSSEVDPASDKDIRQVTEYLKTNPHAKCEIRGYTDNVGADALNLKISQERADNVRKYMAEKLGISPNRLTAHGYGNTDPIASNDTEEGRSHNRRIIALITS